MYVRRCACVRAYVCTALDAVVKLFAQVITLITLPSGGRVETHVDSFFPDLPYAEYSLR